MTTHGNLHAPNGRRIKRKPALLVVVAIVAVALTGWVGLLATTPGDSVGLALASDSTSPGAHDHDRGQSLVVERLRSETAATRFCVSASLEPYDGSVEQIRNSGAGESGERLRRCLVDTLFDHANQPTLDQLEALRPSFEGCFAALATAPPADKPTAIDEALSCIVNALGRGDIPLTNLSA